MLMGPPEGRRKMQTGTISARLRQGCDYVGSQPVRDLGERMGLYGRIKGSYWIGRPSVVKFIPVQSGKLDYKNRSKQF